MSRELIRVDFRNAVIKERLKLGEEAPEYNPFKDEAFKSFTSGVADLARELHADGKDPNRMAVISLDWEAVMFDQEFSNPIEVAECLKRVAAKLETAGVTPIA